MGAGSAACKNRRSCRQKAALFDGTIRDNMRWGKADATDEEILAAIETAQGTDIIKAKGSLDAELTEGGKNLSGGQRQRLDDRTRARTPPRNSDPRRQRVGARLCYRRTPARSHTAEHGRTGHIYCFTARRVGHARRQNHRPRRRARRSESTVTKRFCSTAQCTGKSTNRSLEG